MRVLALFLAAAVLLPSLASAERLRVVVTEPSTTQLGQTLVNLQECTIFVRQGTGVLAEQTIAASSAAGGQSREVFFTDLNAIRGMTGVLQRCKDADGNVSVESAVRSFTFSDAPGPGSVDDVQIVD